MGAIDLRSIAAAAAIALSCAAPARAQDVAAAEALFKRGVSDMQAGRFDSGCPAIAESYRLDPRPGALFTLAECENKRGRIATASARYDEYLRLVATLPAAQRDRHKDRVAIANREKAALDPAVPRLTLTLPADAPAGTIVTRDGTAVGQAALGVALPVDPGEHVITTEAPHGKRREERITVARGENRSYELVVDVVPLPAPPPHAREGDVPRAPPAKPTAAATPQEEKPVGNGQRIAAYAVGGVGAAALVVGAVTGGLALAAKSTVDANCDGESCNQDGLDAAQRGKILGNTSTAMFAIGLAGVGAGLALFFTAPRAEPRAVGVRLVPLVGGAGMTVGGAW